MPRAVTKIAKEMIERLDAQPDSDFIPFSHKEATRLQSVKGNGVALLAKQVDATLQKRRPKEKVAVHNAGATKIREIGKTRNPVRHKKRAKDGYLDVLELDSLRRVRVRK